MSSQGLSKLLLDASRGATSGVISLCIVYPLALAKVKLQAQRKALSNSNSMNTSILHYDGISDCLVSVFNHSGILGLYQGLRAAAMREATNSFIYFFFLSLLANTFKQLKQRTAWAPMLHGMTTGLFVQLITMPMEVVVTTQQVANPNEKKLGILATLFALIRSGGIVKLWATLPAALLLTLNTGINNMLQSVLAPKSGTATATQNFMAGFVSKLCATFTTFPVKLVKVKMIVDGRPRKVKVHLYKEDRARLNNGNTQTTANNNEANNDDDSDEDGDGTTKYPTFVGTTMKIFNESGVGGFYQGIGPQLVSSVASEAIENVVRKNIL
eukprot:m.95016 g.95016  ORF g.95016 m.95016 type:complete len:327 (+) comp26780_c0_seq1:432-1412(+)